jgi:N-acyl-D-aspartate/D-glutamate deacylase
MTSANAAKIGVMDRGVLRPSQWADITVFDADRIIDRATFEKPHQHAEGVAYVIVNGRVVLEQGRHTQARAGQVVRGRGWVPPAAAEGSEMRSEVAP